MLTVMQRSAGPIDMATADVDAAVQFVTAQGRGLFGVINNAGVASLGELTKTSKRRDGRHHRPRGL
jgi:hypothetical protein